MKVAKFHCAPTAYPGAEVLHKTDTVEVGYIIFIFVEKMSGTNPLIVSQNSDNNGWSSNGGTQGGYYNNSWNNKPPPFKAFENAIIDMRQYNKCQDSEGKYLKLSVDPDMEVFAVTSSILAATIA